MERIRIPRAAAERLSLYHRQLEACLARGEETISSRRLAGSLGLTAAQVRKDLAYFGQFGHAGVGYRVEPLLREIRRILGTDRPWPVVLVGAGNLGTALVRYAGFRERGFIIRAVFDSDPRRIGVRIGDVTVRPDAELERVVAEGKIRLAIVAVPAAAAQRVVDRLVRAGIEGIMNFAPVALETPPTVVVTTVDLATQLEQLTFCITHRRGER